MSDNIAQFEEKSIFSISKWFKEFTIPKYIAFVAVFLFSFSVFFTIYDCIEYSLKGNDASKIWYGILDRFTNQSNILLLIFVVFYVFFPKHSFMKNNGFLITCMVFIFFTFIGYNVVLVGISGYGGYSVANNTSSIIGFLSNLCMHILFPIYFIVFGFLHMFFNPMKEPKTFWKLLLLGMIYPTIYVIYVIVVPFIYSGYASKTGATYSVYGNATNVKDYPTSWLYISIMYLGFFPGTFAMFYYSWKGFNSLNKKNKN